MRERKVTKTIADRLSAEGLLNPQARYRNEPGPDIEGTLPRSGRTLYIEAKGERRNVRERVALGEALLQILRYYDWDVVCALAVPYTDGFVRVLRDILPGLRRLGLHLLLVREGEVWYLGPQANGFFPERPARLIEVLDR
jgi:hypothetical protein